MATITINDNSDKRIQPKSIDAYALNTAATIVRGTPTQVGATPKTNSLLTFANNLQNLSKVGNQFVKMQQTAGIEEAASVENSEILENLKNQDPDTFLTYAKQKAFRESLQKRYINTQFLPSVKSEAGNLIDVSKYKTWDEFNQNALQPLVDTKWDEFKEAVGEDLANSESSKVLFAGMTDLVASDLQSKYLDAQDAYTLNNLSEEKSTTLTSLITVADEGTGVTMNVDSKALNDWAQSYDALGKEYGVSNESLVKEMRQNIIDAANRLHLEGKNQNAIALLNEAEKIKINGKSIYMDTGTQESFATIRKNIRNEVESDQNKADTEEYEDSISYATQQLTSAYGYAQYATYSDLTEVQKQGMLEGFQAINPEFTKMDLELYMDKNDGNIYNALEEIQANFSVGGDTVREKWADVSSKVKSQRAVQETLTRPTVLTKEAKNQHVEKFKLEKMRDPELTAENYAKANNFVNFTELNKADTSFQENSWFYTDTKYQEAESRFRTAIEVADNAARGEDNNQTSKIAIDAYMDANYQGYIDGIIERVVSGELTEETAFAEMERLQKEAADRFVSSLHYENSEVGSILDMTRDDMEIREKADNNKTGFIGFRKTGAQRSFNLKEYPSLGALHGGQNINTTTEVDGRSAKEVIDEDRGKMLNWMGETATVNKFWGSGTKEVQTSAEDRQIAINSMKYSLVTYGVDIMDDEGENFDKAMSLLDSVGYDALDVRLFSNPNDRELFMLASQSVLSKRDDITQELTENDRNQLERLEKLGIKNFEDLNEFKRGQLALEETAYQQSMNL